MDAIAARPEPIAKVMEMMRLTLIPINAAAPLSSEHALIARPVFVLLMNKVSTIMITIHVRIVIRVRYGTDSEPIFNDPLSTVGKIFVSVPHNSIALFCRK